MCDAVGTHAAIGHYLRRRDQEGLEYYLIVNAITTADSELLERVMNEEIAVADHETQEWWGAPCNCDGRLN